MILQILISFNKLVRITEYLNRISSCHINCVCVCVCSYFSDKTLIVWKLTRDETNYGIPQKRLYGHSHFISDVVLSSDGNYALSGSWDKTLRLWDLAAGKTTRRFKDHTKVCWSLNWFERRMDGTMQSCCSRSFVVAKKTKRENMREFIAGYGVITGTAINSHSNHSTKMLFPFNHWTECFALNWLRNYFVRA